MKRCGRGVEKLHYVLILSGHHSHMEYLEVITERTRQNCCAALSFPKVFKINYRYPWARSTEVIFTCVLNDTTINTGMAPRQICSLICQVEFQKSLNADWNVDNVFYVLLTAHPGTVLGKWPTWCTNTLYKTFIITILYMFRATLCLSSGGRIVLIQHLVQYSL